MSVVLVADAGPSAGLGHLSRTGAVAAALRARGLAVRCLAAGAEATFERDGIGWDPLDPGTSPPAAPVTVLDSYGVDAQAAGKIAERSSLVLMHERGPVPPATRLVVGAAPSGGPAGASTRRLVGLRYACLRPPFWGLPLRETWAAAARVLVATGAGDFEGVGAELATAAREALPGAEVRLVRGPYSSDEVPAGVVGVDRPEALLHELLGADLILTAGGQTLLEAAAAGTPAAVVVLAEDQRSQAEDLAGAGAAVLAGDGDAAAAAGALTALAANQGRRAELARASQQLIDGYGALRVAFEIARLAPWPA